jgi:hypothetical protein
MCQLYQPWPEQIPLMNMSIFSAPSSPPWSIRHNGSYSPTTPSSIFRIFASAQWAAASPNTIAAHPHTVVDYTFFGLNDDTVPIAPWDAMQFGITLLPRLLCHGVLADPAHGSIIQLIKVDIADGFYRIGVRPD